MNFLFRICRVDTMLCTCLNHSIFAITYVSFLNYWGELAFHIVANDCDYCLCSVSVICTYLLCHVTLPTCSLGHLPAFLLTYILMYWSRAYLLSHLQSCFLALLSCLLASLCAYLIYMQIRVAPILIFGRYTNNRYPSKQANTDI